MRPLPEHDHLNDQLEKHLLQSVQTQSLLISPTASSLNREGCRDRGIGCTSTSLANNPCPPGPS